jgi:hypothetical protein
MIIDYLILHMAVLQHWLQTAAKPQMQLCKNGEAAIEAAALKSDSV